MNTQEFEAVENKIKGAVCVEDVFGDKEPTAIDVAEFESRILKFRMETSNSNLRDRAKLLLKHQIPFFRRWVFKQKLLKKYGNRDNFPLAIHFKVSLIEGKEMLCIGGEESILYISKIKANHFNIGKHHNKVIVRKDNRIIHEGHVISYGTRTEQIFFKGIAEDDSNTTELAADMYEIGTTVEIQTWAFFTIGDYLAKAWV